MRHGPFSRRRLALATVMVVLGGAVTTVSQTAAATPSPAGAAAAQAVSTVGWRRCYQEVTRFTGVGYQCGRVMVPLDYDQPNGTQIPVEMVRIPATRPGRKIGSVLLNPGGPGGSGISFALGFGPAFGAVFGAEVRERFDIIGFDPRGIGASRPIRCYRTFEESLAGWAPISFPLDAADEQLFIDADTNLAERCTRRDPPIAEHMSTANVARDMDVIRERLGESSLNFLGLSYGTYLGATYANMFPDRVRSVVVDGVLDPVAWVNEPAVVPFSTSLRSDEGAQETLEAFFALCDAAEPGNCALAPGSKERFAALAESVRAEPRVVVDPETGEEFLVTYRDMIGISLGLLYNAFGYAQLAELLAELEAAAPAERLGRLLLELEQDSGVGLRRPREAYDNAVEGFPGVACTDTNNPADYSAWSEAGVAAERDFGYFGRLWTWASSPCARWPFTDDDRYVGPFTNATANPVLVIGNLYDPATRYEGAQALRSLLPNSGLLTVDLPGHTSLGGNACAGFVTGQYLLDPSVALAADGTTCPAEYNPFDLDAGGGAGPAAVPAAVADAARDGAPTTSLSRDGRRALIDVVLGARR